MWHHLLPTCAWQQLLTSSCSYVSHTPTIHMNNDQHYWQTAMQYLIMGLTFFTSPKFLGSYWVTYFYYICNVLSSTKFIVGLILLQGMGRVLNGKVSAHVSSLAIRLHLAIICCDPHTLLNMSFRCWLLDSALKMYTFLTEKNKKFSCHGRIVPSSTASSTSVTLTNVRDCISE